MSEKDYGLLRDAGEIILCPYGCKSIFCESCKPKLVRCPNCGKPAYLELPFCPYCRQTIPEEARQTAIRNWEQTGSGLIPLESGGLEQK